MCRIRIDKICTPHSSSVSDADKLVAFSRCKQLIEMKGDGDGDACKREGGAAGTRGKEKGAGRREKAAVACPALPRRRRLNGEKIRCADPDPRGWAESWQHSERLI
jgi:hypothetical protein